jgi:hypothetical protein
MAILARLRGLSGFTHPAKPTPSRPSGPSRSRNLEAGAHVLDGGRDTPAGP